MRGLDSILYESIVYLTPTLLCVLGGIFAYKANVLNIALEGMMLAGAFVSVLVAHSHENKLFLAYLAAFAVCIFLGLVFSVLGVTLKGNVIIIGLAINMLVPAVAGFVMKLMSLASIPVKWFSTNSILISIPVIRDIPILGPLFSGHPPITYISYLLILVMYLLMYKTKFGVHVRVVGENEDAAINLGLNTKKYKILAVLIGAGCCGLAGTDLALERLSLYTNNMTAGRGFIAIAAIYCGRGDPLKCTLYAILFSITNAVAEYFSLLVSASLLLKVVPYVVMVVVLSAASALNRRNSRTRGAFSEN